MATKTYWVNIYRNTRDPNGSAYYCSHTIDTKRDADFSAERTFKRSGNPLVKQIKVEIDDNPLA